MLISGRSDAAAITRHNVEPIVFKRPDERFDRAFDIGRLNCDYQSRSRVAAAAKVVVLRVLALCRIDPNCDGPVVH